MNNLTQKIPDAVRATAAETPEQHILIVEDDPHMSEWTQRILQVGGYEAVVCKNISEARRSLRETPPRMMILDGSLPDGSGIHFCREARDGGYDAPILIHTGLSSADSRKAGFDAGCSDYLKKPCDAMLLLSKMKVYLDIYEGRTPAAKEAATP
jgi:DNA-binding response OmpR family regulator